MPETMKKDAMNVLQNNHDDGPPLLPSSLSASYARDGFVGPIQVFTRQEAQELLKEFEVWMETLALSSRTNDKEERQCFVLGNLRFKPHLHLAFCNRIVRHATLIKAVQEVLQTKDILLWSSDFNIKPPLSKQWFPPHQDSTHAGLLPANKCVTAWVALSDPVSTKEGCLSFYKGSHKYGQIDHAEDTNDTTNMLSRGQYIRNEDADAIYLDDCEHVLVPLRGGEATLHNFYTVHESGPNLSPSKKPRIGLAIRYMAATVRQTGPTRECVTLISGSTQHDGCFDLEPNLPLDHPTDEDVARGLKAHVDAMQRETANYFQGSQKKHDQDISIVPGTTKNIIHQSYK